MFKRIWSAVGLLPIVGGVVAVLAAAAPASGPPGLSKAAAVKDRHAKQLFAHSGVVGVGVGRADGHTVIVVLTARAGVTGIPPSLDGVKVLTQESGPIRALRATGSRPMGQGKGGSQSPASFWQRPVPIGVSTGRADECEAGTIGARVTDGTNVYALSANHVYGLDFNDSNLSEGPSGEAITQPGLYDAKPKCVLASDDGLGTLSNWVPIDFSSGASNTVDAAIAQTSTGDLGDATPSNGYGTPSSTTVPESSLSLGTAVQKYGERTGLTHGIVCLTDFDVDVTYTSTKVAHFIDQIGVCNSHGQFSNSGDSGSLVVTDDSSKDAVGLLFAGGGRYTFANPIDDVLSDLGVSIDNS